LYWFSSPSHLHHHHVLLAVLLQTQSCQALKRLLLQWLLQTRCCCCLHLATAAAQNRSSLQGCSTSGSITAAASATVSNRQWRVFSGFHKLLMLSMTNSMATNCTLEPSLCKQTSHIVYNCCSQALKAKSTPQLCWHSTHTHLVKAAAAAAAVAADPAAAAVLPASALHRQTQWLISTTRRRQTGSADAC
jgi:hypothetical protein